jgi:beta-glucanase (GH16 family)
MSARLAVISLAVIGLMLGVVAARRSSNASNERHSSSESVAWSDNFSGPRGQLPDPRKWSLETGYGWGDGELQSYTGRPANVSLDGRGHLAITARRERYTGHDGRTASYTSARLNTQRKFEFAYGNVEARIRMPSGHGLLPAFWAAGSNLDVVGWPDAGEIDIVEVNGNEPFTVHGTLHGPLAGHKDFALEQTRHTRVPLARRFHVYGVTWSPDRIAFRFDGRVYGVETRSSLPSGARWTLNHPFFLLLTLAVGPRWLGPPDATTRFPATMLVDWVRVRLRPATFCPVVRALTLRTRCPRRPRSARAAASERAR